MICTSNIKQRVGYHNIMINRKDNFDKISFHIKRALRHEAIHIAQECNNGNLLNLKTKLRFNYRCSIQETTKYII